MIMRGINSIGGGSVGTGEAVYDRVVGYLTENQDRFYRLAFSYVHNRQDALDIVQNAVVKALERYPSIRNPDYLRTWFYRVLVNESLSYLEAGRRELLTDGEAFRELAAPEEPESEDGLYRRIIRLPEEMKTVVILRFFEDMTLKDISRVMDANLNTTKSRLYTALERLRQGLREDAL